MFTLYGLHRSPNCYKPALAMKQLGVPYRWKFVDVVSVGARPDWFQEMSPSGRVPLLEETDGQRVLPCLTAP